MSAVRRYCWRVGGVYEVPEGEVCPECGSPDHEPAPAGYCYDVTHQGPNGTTEGAYHCVRPPGHEGPCQHGAATRDPNGP